MRRFPNGLIAVVLFLPLILSMSFFLQSRSRLEDVLENQQRQKIAAEQRTRGAVEHVITLIREDVRALLRAHDHRNQLDLSRLLRRIERLLERPPGTVTTILRRTTLKESTARPKQRGRSERHR